MRKSALVTLTVLTALGSAFLVGCDDKEDAPQQAEFFTGVDDCQTHESNATLCQDSERAAQRDHEATAPRYADRQVCESAIGQCTELLRPDANGNLMSVFIPAMAGYVIARSLDGAVTTRPVYAGPAPDCQTDSRNCQQQRSGGGGSVGGAASTASGRYFYSGGSYVGSGSASSSVTAGGRAASPGFTVARGGFGASAGAHAGGGS